MHNTGSLPKNTVNVAYKDWMWSMYSAASVLSKKVLPTCIVLVCIGYRRSVTFPCSALTTDSKACTVAVTAAYTYVPKYDGAARLHNVSQNLHCPCPG